VELNDTFEGEEAKPDSTDGRRNIVRKKVPVFGKDGVSGEIAHYHRKENAVEEWDEPCYFVEHFVDDAKGFSINEKRYKGKVVVPQCMADYLAWQESMRKSYEEGIFRGKVRSRVAGAV